MFLCSCEEMMLRDVKKSIDRGLAALLGDFKNKENLCPAWHVKALKVCLRTKGRMVRYKVDLLRTGLVEVDKFDRKYLMVVEMELKLRQMSNYHNQI